MIVQRVTALVVIFVALTCAYLDTWMTEESTIFINNFYYTSDKGASQAYKTSMDSFIGSFDDNKYVRLVRNDSVLNDTQPQIKSNEDTI